MSSSDVKATKALTATGQAQGYIGTGAGTATNLGPIRIQSVQAQASAADGSIKIYDGTSASGTKLLIEFKFGSAANESFDHYLPNDGVRFQTGAYVVLANCDFFVAYYN
jgi:hypothetical protein|tara:strand:- start:2201 stop:2527 length:327 start_codon:yes stop_codon:yes gene_type:complete